MRACVQCGLSIGETATFCAVCGARFEPAAEIAAMTETSAPFEAVPVVAEPGEEEAQSEAASDVSEPDPELGPAESDVDGAVESDEVAEGPEPVAAGDSDEVDEAVVAPEAVETDDVVVAPEAVEADEVVVAPEAVEADEGIEADEGDTAAEDPVERKVAEVAALLEDAAGCEDVARAAALYQEAIVECLEAADDPLGCDGVRGELLRGFDGLSSLLERQGLAEESLAVVDDAASLGLLNGGEHARSASREALRERRESLRRALFVDSAQL